MAFFIMIYHYFSWSFHHYKSDTFLGIIGIYGVSIFYILSGLTLFYVYDDKLRIQNLLSFFIKRIFRILPLLWVSIFLNIFLLGKTHDLNTILLNISGLFGFIDHDNYITTGAWSIGNELVFYSFFPIVIILNNWKKYAVEVFFIFSLFLAIYFAFWKLSNTADLGNQWSDYINPLNQIFLFIGGMLIGKIVGNKRSNLFSLILLLFCILLMFFYQVSGNQINLVSGWNRLFFSSISFIVTIAFLVLNPITIHKNIDWLLSKLGHISYSIYLLHAIVFWFVAKYINRTEFRTLFLSICITSTVILSYFSYNYLELKCINIGTLLLKKIKLFKQLFN